MVVAAACRSTDYVFKEEGSDERKLRAGPLDKISTPSFCFSATIGCIDLSGDRGTENFGGVKPGCWFNGIPAGGMVLVPDRSSQCACSYQMRSWLALQPRRQLRLTLQGASTAPP